MLKIPFPSHPEASYAPLSSVHPYIFLIAKKAKTNQPKQKLSLAISFCVRLMQKHPMLPIFASCRVLIISLLIIPLLVIPLLIIPLLIILLLIIPLLIILLFIIPLLIIPRHPSLYPAGVSLQSFDHLFFLLLQSGDANQVHQIQGAARNSVFANES